MAAILVLRTVKGSPLLNTEVDNNFSNLNIFGDVVSSNVGVLANLTTTTKANLVEAVNEVRSFTATVDSNVGVLTNLTTTAKTNVVEAVNEVRSSVTSSSIVFAIALG